MTNQIQTNKEGVLEIWCDASTWSDFQKVIRHLKSEFGGKVVNKAEGPDARCWRLLIGTVEITVSQSDFGSFPLCVSSQQTDSEEILQQIAKSIGDL